MVTSICSSLERDLTKLHSNIYLKLIFCAVELCNSFLPQWAHYGKIPRKSAFEYFKFMLPWARRIIHKVRAYMKHVTMFEITFQYTFWCFRWIRDGYLLSTGSFYQAKSSLSDNFFWQIVGTNSSHVTAGHQTQLSFIAKVLKGYPRSKKP